MSIHKNGLTIYLIEHIITSSYVCVNQLFQSNVEALNDYDAGERKPETLLALAAHR